jgi:type I restriction enzyme M protein
MTIQLANFVWGIADQIRGVYKPAQYGQVILPFAILRRMEAVMNGHRDEIRALAEKMPNEQALAAKFRRDFDLHFWNTSTWTLKTLLGDPENLAANLIDYVAKFSSNVADIFEQFGFEKTIAKLDENDRLFIVVDAFADVDLHPSVLSNTDMGQMFEHLIYKFSTASNETAGEHFTPRDAIKLMVDLLLDPDSDVLSVAGTVRTIYDPTAGTGGMLSVTEESIHLMNEHAQVALAGQELNPESYAMCKADMIGKGQDVGAIRRGDTLLKDLHEGTYFDYCLSNPPYGGDWRAAEAAVRAEHKRAFAGRFGAGLPRISDGQMLFLQHLVAKMRPAKAGDPNSGGRAAIVLNGSPLFTGGAGSGESEIRRWLIESDLIDAIIALPTNMFYNTGIATYIWLLDNNKPAHRKGKIQLIDATEFGTKMRKNLGSKNKEISEDDRDRIVKLYSEMADGEHSKILEAADFGYWEITVEQPLQLRFDVTPEAVDAAMEQRAITKLDDDVKARVRAALESLVGRSWMSRDDFLPAVQVALRNQNKTVVGAPVMRAIWQAIGVHDDAAEVVRNSKGRPEPDPSLRDTELVPFRDDIEAYFEREVLPHVPNAWIDRAKTKVGYEIPFTRLFYKYVPPRDLAEIDADLERVTAEIIEMLKAVEG